jgi:hypothetical protein
VGPVVVANHMDIEAARLARATIPRIAAAVALWNRVSFPI